MAQSELSIYNEALSLVGGQAGLTAVDQKGPEAASCRLHYPTVKRAVFDQAFWPSSKMSKILALSAENDFKDDWTEADPVYPWRYAYELPTGFLNALELFSVDVDASPSELVSYGGNYGQFEITYWEPVAGLALMTNLKDAGLVFSREITDPAGWDINLYQAVVWHLAHRLVMPTSANTGFVNQILAQANFFTTRALENNANKSEETLTEPVSDIEAARLGYARASFRRGYHYYD